MAPAMNIHLSGLALTVSGSSEQNVVCGDVTSAGPCAASYRVAASLGNQQLLRAEARPSLIIV